MPEDEKIVSIPLYLEEVPRLNISYKDKYELFKKFQKKLKKLDFPTDELYWYDWENVHLRIRNADDVLLAVEESGFAKMFARDPRNRDTFPSFSSDDDDDGKEMEEERKKEEIPIKTERRGRSRSSSGVRGRSRSEPRHGSHHHAEHFYQPSLKACMPWINPRFGFMPFYYDPRAFDAIRSRNEERKHKCHCKQLSEDKKL
ncbi:hypothetical protein RB195_005070 [Necator americanus]|uniref:PB1 domain-containing protein n=1 Tax=Necator americanus TaxID=51031 RepID=A0ABR1BL22_NECAM